MRSQANRTEVRATEGRVEELYAEVPVMTVAQLRQMLDTGEDMVLLDVREAFEWELSNLGEHGAILMPMGEIPARLGELNPAERVVVYCRTGARSDLITRFLLTHGFEQVWNLEGGINEWARQFDPDMRTY